MRFAISRASWGTGAVVPIDKDISNPCEGTQHIEGETTKFITHWSGNQEEKVRATIYTIDLPDMMSLLEFVAQQGEVVLYPRVEGFSIDHFVADNPLEQESLHEMPHIMIYDDNIE